MMLECANYKLHSNSTITSFLPPLFSHACHCISAIGKSNHIYMHMYGEYEVYSLTWIFSIASRMSCSHSHKALLHSSQFQPDHNESFQIFTSGWLWEIFSWLALQMRWASLMWICVKVHRYRKKWAAPKGRSKLIPSLYIQHRSM